jgi:hypothetical protein
MPVPIYTDPSFVYSCYFSFMLFAMTSPSEQGTSLWKIDISVVNSVARCIKPGVRDPNQRTVRHYQSHLFFNMRNFQFLLPVLSAVSPVIAQTSGTFNVLTFNVAGLPPIFNGNEIPGDKTENTARIGQLFTQYNHSIIHVQEDFNFHAALYANDKHPHRTPTSGGVPFGSGLNTLSNYAYSTFERVKWATCSNFE